MYNSKNLYAMIVIIPLGGTGERFKKHGYTKPKALIPVFGKPILFHLLDNLSLESVHTICIPYQSEYASYHFEDMIRHRYRHSSFHFVRLTRPTRGAAETIHLALMNSSLANDQPVLCLDADNFYTTDILSLWNGKNTIFTFHDAEESSSPLYSYVETVPATNQVVRIVEKQKISNDCCTGAYGFASSAMLLEYTQRVLDLELKQKGEFYTSTVIGEMLSVTNFDMCPIDAKDYICLGTPWQLLLFYNHARDTQEHLRICFDLDNTLVTFPRVEGDYTTVEPISKNIAFLRYLKSLGHTIIIYTARRMRTCLGNVGKCVRNIGKITFDTLEKYEIECDEIYFGKPHADVYIDDLALNCQTNLEKELGFYMDHIDPRNFNSLEVESIDTFRKSSRDLSGEIYYYQNIPKEIKELFPILIDTDPNNTWYVVERIHGTTLSYLYVNELLTETLLLRVMEEGIHRIHSLTLPTRDYCNIYQNYATKLKERYTRYDYSRFPQSQSIYEALWKKLHTYETKKRGRKTIIHGDTVMTNILVNEFDRVKFIDMRGKQGSDLSIYGDCFYDWAKLYQSILGYDRILQKKVMSTAYETRMRDFFESFIRQKFSDQVLDDLKTIVKSLLFSLIPLHDNSMCFDFYTLMLNID